MLRALVFEGTVVGISTTRPEEGDKVVPGTKPHLVPITIDKPDCDPDRQILERVGYEVSEDQLAVTERWNVRDLTELEMDILVGKKILQVKEEAGKRILDIMPTHKQINWLALKAEMDLTYGAFEDWPIEVKNSVAVVLPLWGKIKVLREQSNEIEATVASSKDPKEIRSYDVSKAFDDLASGK